MSPAAAKQNLILLGLVSVESIPSIAERITYLEAAAALLEDHQLAQRCSVTARCLAEAEAAQLRLFQTIKPSLP